MYHQQIVLVYPQLLLLAGRLCKLEGLLVQELILVGIYVRFTRHKYARFEPLQ